MAKTSIPFLKGGKTKMFGKQASGTRASGVTSPGGGGKAKSAKWGAGGTTKMFGKQSSTASKAR